MSRPKLRLVDSAPPPPLELPQERAPWWDGSAAGWAIVVSLLSGAVLMCLALGWIRL